MAYIIHLLKQKTAQVSLLQKCSTWEKTMIADKGKKGRKPGQQI